MKSDAAVNSLAALAQPSRLANFRLLVRAGLTGLYAGRIGEALGLPPATLSFHFKALSHAGLIASHQEERNVLYRVQFPPMKELIDFLMEHCCQGDAKGRVAPGVV
ncbi:transcriptional regulator [Cupriavidus sp. USMAHM13]|uniref:ArsR/SmtB family transcription factor n=1 Tax=Cupriavidus sp. USMAHM13 TaxID=1389192 RepID=UPI0008A704B2|nr:metalloregulator ArsR/SmtB family transcription factor [Cupriavidus sp. USMAHM13]AOZ00895.1 transcriptional regulator [Cupriavidus sp. USMAHM13]